MSVMTIPLLIVCAIAAVAIVVSRKWPLWTGILVMPVLVLAVNIVWWAVKTVVSIAIALAIIAALFYGVWWLFFRSATEKK